MVKNVVVSALAGAVVIFILAGFFFGFLFADFFANNTPAVAVGVAKKTVNYGLIAISDLVYATMLAFVLASISGPKTFKRGALVGSIIGFMVVLHFDLLTYATTHMTTGLGIAANVAISTGMSAIGGGVVAFVFGRFENKKEDN